MEYRLVRVGDRLGREALAVRRRHCPIVVDDIKSFSSNGPDLRRQSDRLCLV